MKKTDVTTKCHYVGPLLALFGRAAMSDLSPLCAPKRTPATHYESMSSHPSIRCWQGGSTAGPFH
jgi:hypothetical protein